MRKYLFVASYAELSQNVIFLDSAGSKWLGLGGILLFATTHSRECMEAAHRAAASMKGAPPAFPSFGPPGG
jgi:hypothetical protein